MNGASTCEERVYVSVVSVETIEIIPHTVKSKLENVNRV